jgi:folate-binding protein YgfZ
MVITPHPVLPTGLTDSSTQLSALLTGAGVAPLDHTGWIRVTGEDRVRWLNGMVTNSIQDLAPGQGCYNFVLNAQGRIQADLTAWMLEDSILLETGQAGKVATSLDHFIIMDDVELTVLGNGRDESETAASNGYPFLTQSPGRTGLLIAGPQAISILQRLDFPIGQLSTLHIQSTIWNTAPLDIIHAYSPLVQRVELWSDQVTIHKLTQTILDAGAVQVSPETLEHLRILEGTPLYATDIRNSETSRDLPQETAQTRALHFSKGCYLGQEIVERIRSRGNVHRTFTGFELTGTLPTPGTPLEAEGKPIGELTSVAAIEHPTTGPIQIALGYIRREALDRALPLTYPGGTATPITLPWSPT